MRDILKPSPGASYLYVPILALNLAQRHAVSVRFYYTLHFIATSDCCTFLNGVLISVSVTSVTVPS